ncbi:WD40-repeat-containing domain protein [Thelephora terrestris]|uniref:WD40-repeat-containing domain protein n=1 Tax=Thelephora terrestris TaxID=56493 RepID=A0A9P6HKU7_9AGAM|nr:WD40-repeat-containing domain protein [Thelephora terrestris]
MSHDGPSLTTTLEGHTSAVTVVEFSPDGKFLASAGDDGVVLIFSTSSWTPMHRFLDVSPVTVLAWHQKRRYLLLCGHQSGDLHFLTMSKSMKCTVVQTSTFAGHIHSLSLSPTSPGIAIAYGNEIALAVVISNPYRLKDDREYLPKPPAYHLGANKPGGPVAKSLQFTRKKNHLVVTYAAHGIVIWDPHALTVAGEIVPRTFPIGRSVVAADDDTMAVSNLINGVDWYSLSNLTFLSTTKLPAGTAFCPSSALNSSEDGTPVVLGGAEGSAYILSRERGVKTLEHGGGSSIIRSVALAPTVRGQALIAAGTGELNGRATVTIWTLIERKVKYGIPFVAIQNVVPVGLTLSHILINGALLFLCCAWLGHFLTRG